MTSSQGQALVAMTAALRGEDTERPTPPPVTEALGHLRALIETGTDPLTSRFRSGLAWVDLPVGRGGLSIDPEHQEAADRESAKAGVPDPPPDAAVGVAMVGPAIALFGSEEQRELLEPSFTGALRWCQLFSEPDAGSDLASLATRATRSETGWRITGQKVWTSNANRATHGLLLARTGDPSDRHRGLTMFVFPMDTPGLEIRPLRQMNGESRFYEVFMDDMELPEEARLGEESRGWYVAMEVLNRERRSVHRGLVEDVVSTVDLLAGSRPARDLEADAWRRLVVDHLVNTLFERRLIANDLLSVHHFGPLLKLAQSALYKAISETAVNALGPAGQLARYDVGGPGWAADETSSFLRGRANSIEGGTTEILKSVVAEQGLGLPKN